MKHSVICHALAAALFLTPATYIGARHIYANENCNFALNPLPTCSMNNNTGSCATNICHVPPEDGTDYSDNDVFETVPGTGLLVGVDNVPCHRPMTCDEDFLLGKKCDEVFSWLSFCITSEDPMQDCRKLTKTLGNWVPAPSANVIACPTY